MLFEIGDTVRNIESYGIFTVIDIEDDKYLCEDIDNSIDPEWFSEEVLERVEE